MYGDSAMIIAADAYIKGIQSYDVNELYSIGLASSQLAEEYNGKAFVSNRVSDLEKYRTLYRSEAYEPYSLPATLELLIADYAMSKLAQALGYQDDAEYFLNRANRYVENYNPNTGFMGPRDESGNFIPADSEYFEVAGGEGNIFHLTWSVPYDIIGLSKLLGEDRTISLLDRFFEGADLAALWNKDYNHSNEFCHNVTHYFNILGLPHKTQYWTRKIQKEAYRLDAFGFCGNEDVGQISAWYALSALGFAQVVPTSGQYQINTPLFKTVKIALDAKYHTRENSEFFTVKCDKDPLLFPYIEKMYLNGEQIDRTYVTYQEITTGGTLELVLSQNPNT